MKKNSLVCMMHTNYIKQIVKKTLIVLSLSILSLNYIQAQVPTLPIGGVTPDNIIESDCFSEPPKREWSISPMKDVNRNIFSGESVILVGDVDGDGSPEIVLVGPNYGGNQKLYILDGKTQKIKFQFPVDASYTGINPLAGIAKVKWTDGSMKSIILMYTSNSTSFCAYDINGNKLWTSDEGMKQKTFGVCMQILDIDGDGLSEIICAGNVVAAETGRTLTRITNNYQGLIHSWDYTNNFMHQSMVGNLKNDGSMRLCIGNTIWKFNTKLTNRYGLNPDALVLEKTFPNQVYIGSSPMTVPTGGDGCVQLADIDLDGNLDIIVSTVKRENVPNNSTYYLYVYSWAKDKIIGSKIINNVYKHSIPFVGDIDGDKYPEILITHGAEVGNNLNTQYDFISALKYNASSQELDFFWRTPHNDNSGATGMTLFDFNQDGVAEIIYRDNTHLRIMDGSKSTGVRDLAKFDCTSSTAFEYPTVADVDNDGQAEILMTGGTADVIHSGVGQLFVFKAGPEVTGNPTFWSKARPVWNTLSYNPLFVNEDLTTPKVLLSQATIYPGEDGILGTADDVQPYNNFLQQQTNLNKYGTPFWLAANAQFFGQPVYDYDKYTDKLKITLKISNIGDNTLYSPFYITIYKNKLSVDSKKYTYIYNSNINPNDTIETSIILDNFMAEWNPNNAIIINLNDKGDASQAQGVCAPSTPILYHPILPTDQDGCADSVNRKIVCPYAIENSKFQWQMSYYKDLDWTNIPNATTREININQTRGTCYYRTIVELPSGVILTSDPTKVRIRSCAMPVNHNLTTLE